MNPYQAVFSRTWARKRAFKQNGYCFLQYIKPAKRWEALRSLCFKTNPTAAQVWALRKWFHDYVDYYEITKTSPGLVHLRRHDQANNGYFTRTFSLSLGRIGSQQTELVWDHIWEPSGTWGASHLVHLRPKKQDASPSDHALALTSFWQTLPNQPSPPHPNRWGNGRIIDETFHKYLRDYLISPFTNQTWPEGLPLRQYVEKLATKEAWLVPAEATLTRSQRQGAFRRVMISTNLFYKSCDRIITALETIKEAEEKISDLENAAKRQRRETDDKTAELLKLKEFRKQDQERLQMVDQNLAKAEESLHAIADKWMLQLEMTEFTGWSFNMNLMKRLAKIRSILTGGIDTLSFNLDQLELDAQEFRESHDDAHSQNMNWALMLERTMDGLKDMPDVEAEIRRLQKRANQSPYWDLLNTPPRERRFTASSEELANEIRTRVLEMLGTIWAELPRDVIAPPASPVTNIKESISRLKNKINRLSTSFTQLSNNQQNTQPPNMATYEQAQRQVWNRLPAFWRTTETGEEIPFSEENLNTALAGLPTGRPVAPDCGHFALVSDAIGDHMDPLPKQWDTMLTHIATHCNPDRHGPPPERRPSPAPSHMSISDHGSHDDGHFPPPAPAVRAGTWRNFRGDLATFDGDNSKYAEWKNQLRVWVGTNPDAPPQLVVAHVLTRLVGAASYWAVRNRGNRFSMLGALEVPPALAVEQLLTEMDKAYTAIGAEVAAQNHIRTIKQGEQESMTEYLVKFQKMLEESGYDETDKFILDRFPNSLRGPVRDQLNLEISRRRLNDDPPFRFNQMTRWAQHWDTLIPRQRRQNADERPRKDAPAESQYSSSFQLPTACLNHTDRNGCPQHLKGTLGDRESAGGVYKRAAILEIGRCLTCRGLKQPGEDGYVAQPPAPAAEWPADIPQPAPRTTRSGGPPAGRGRGYRGRGQ